MGHGEISALGQLLTCKTPILSLLQYEVWYALKLTDLHVRAVMCISGLLFSPREGSLAHNPFKRQMTGLQQGKDQQSAHRVEQGEAAGGAHIKLLGFGKGPDA